MSDLTGQCVVVTGGSRGIGLDIAKAFAQKGAKVAILGRNLEAAAAAAKELDGEAEAFACDVSNESQVTEAFAKITESFGRIDVLVNNAGLTRDNLIPRMKCEDWDLVMDANLKGVYLCSKAVVRTMLRQKAGRIVNISSIIGLTGNAGQSNYAASKAGMIGFTKSMAKEVASRGVTVNAIAPGMIDTDMTRELKDEVREQIIGNIPLARLGSGEDIAHAVLFLAGSGGAYITGETIRVDGGMAI